MSFGERLQKLAHLARELDTRKVCLLRRRGGLVVRGSGPIAGAVAAWRACADKTPARRDVLMKLWIDAEVLRLGSMRAQATREKGVPGPEGWILKLLSGMVGQGVSELVVDLMGAGGMLCASYAQDADSEAAPRDPVLAFVSSPASTIHR